MDRYFLRWKYLEGLEDSSAAKLNGIGSDMFR